MDDQQPDEVSSTATFLRQELERLERDLIDRHLAMASEQFVRDALVRRHAVMLDAMARLRQAESEAMRRELREDSLRQAVLLLNELGVIRGAS